jgi:predicted RNA binding protein YcfA (HicA-like mRNA interferase family)
MHGLRKNIALGLVAFACAGFGIAYAQKPKPKAKIAYATISSIIKNCAMCHSGPQPKHNLNLTSYASLMKGDHEGKVVVPGKPVQSRLSKAVHWKGAASMPPMGRLPAADVAKIDAWIKAGANK